MKPTYKFSLRVPLQVEIAGKRLDRESFYAWLWREFEPRGLLGIHEGTVLAEQAHSLGAETESWAVDSAQAPSERDWVGGLRYSRAELYFDCAETAQSSLQRLPADLVDSWVQEQKAQDWDQEWKKAFLEMEKGILIPPFWRVTPPWVSFPKSDSNEVLLKINPGAGFGTGTHETTQLCLTEIGEASLKSSLRSRKALDFGSGSGILAVAAALLGAEVNAIEIDELALENAYENARLNEVERNIRYFKELQDKGDYDLIVANILRPILLQFASELVHRLKPGGVLILSGLIEPDLGSVISTYEALGLKLIKRKSQNEWRGLVFNDCKSDF